MNSHQAWLKLTGIMRRQMPVEWCHTGRGIPHSEACARTCYDSWERTVADICQEFTWDKKQFLAEVTKR